MDSRAPAALPPPSPPAAQNYTSDQARLPSLKVSLSFRDGTPKTLERYFSSRTTFASPDHEAAELYRVFQKFDRDGDGRLSVDEISASLKKLGITVTVEDLHSLFPSPRPLPQLQADESPTGTAEHLGFDFEEFRALYRDLCRYDEDEGCSNSVRGLSPNPDARGVSESDLRSAFALFDKNGDGYISVVELQSVLLSLGFKEAHSLEFCRRMIAIVDSDGDGRVNFAEFRTMMKDEKFS